jgi:hypothetical protein
MPQKIQSSRSNKGILNSRCDGPTSTRPNTDSSSSKDIFQSIKFRKRAKGKEIFSYSFGCLGAVKMLGKQEGVGSISVEVWNLSSI